jgi:NitT/TauT family transport system substrate-binding protein
MAGEPKPAFYAVVLLVVAGLIGFAVYRADIFAPKGKPAAQPKSVVDAKELGLVAEATGGPGVTTVKEYSFKPAEKLPAVKGVSNYQALGDDKTVRFALNVWAGWGPIILANNGSKPEKIWKTPDGEEFKVELVLIDDPVQMLNTYAAGKVHVGWATLDMLPLFLTRLQTDSRVMPRVYQQVDWSNGGDGIVVRDYVKTVADLRGKKLALAQNSPSQYFALNMLVAGGVQPSEVDMVYTNTAFEAAAAFNGQKDLAGAVSWSPDIYKLSKVKGNRMLVNTGTANKLIADVWFARADFAKDHPGIIEALVRGIFDGMEDMKNDAKKQQCAKLMAQFYNIQESEAMDMFGDAHNTNWAENYQFFVNQNNPTNFERVWKQSYYLYGRIGKIEGSQVSFDQVMDFSVIAKLGQDPKYSQQKDEYQIKLTPKSVSQVRAESEEILTNTIVIHFYPNSWDLHKKITREIDGKPLEQLYDPRVDSVLEEAGKLAGQFGNARIIVEGHTDGSYRGKVPEEVVKRLSMDRANAVKEAIAEKFKLDPNQFAADGKGWDEPADRDDPENHAKNRRVEIKIYPAEKQ